MINLLWLFLEFFKIGLFTFGGGYAMIPLIEETVLRHEWLTEAQFQNFIGVCESTPGPIAVNMATYIGSTQFGFLGSVVATLGVVLPSFIIIVLVASILTKFTKNPYFKNFIEGVKPVILALIVSTGLSLLIQNIGYNFQSMEFIFNYRSLIVFTQIVLIYLIFRYWFKIKLNAIMIILISVVLGLLVGLI